MPEEKFATKQTVKGNSLPNKLWIEKIFQTNFKGNLYQRVFEKICPPKKPEREISPIKIFEKKTLPPTNLSNNFSTKNNPEKLYQGNSEETSPAKEISDQKSLPKISQENWRKISTKKNLKKKIYQKKKRNISTKKSEKTTQETWQESELMKSDETSRFYKISSVSMFAVFHQKNNLIFVGGYFSWNCFS